MFLLFVIYLTFNKSYGQSTSCDIPPANPPIINLYAKLLEFIFLDKYLFALKFSYIDILDAVYILCFNKAGFKPVYSCNLLFLIDFYKNFRE